MIIDTFDVRPRAWSGAQRIAHEREVDFMVRARVPRGVHQLDGKVDALGRGVGAVAGQNVLLPEDRRLALDHESGTLLGVGDDAVAEGDALAWLQLDLQGHDCLRTVDFVRSFPIVIYGP